MTDGLKLRKKIKKKWIAALTDGSYRRGRGALRPTEDTFCCLGVLCDLAVRDGIGSWEFQTPRGPRGYIGPGGGVITVNYLPRVVVEWAFKNTVVGDWSDPRLPIPERPGVEYRLSILNDQLGTDFQHIAERIQESL